MAVDVALLEAVAAGESPPVFRIYQWSSPALSLGLNQDAAQELDASNCAQAGLEVVRRPTGGRAVLHWEELTYSLMCGRDDPLVGGSTQETYRTIGLCLVAGLKLCGLDLELERSVPSPVGRRATGGAGGGHGPCFASAARWEVKCRGRKLVGSAQRRMGGGILQHGSIPMGPEYRMLPRFLKRRRQPREASELARQLSAASTCMAECSAATLTADEVGACLVLGVQGHLGVEMQRSELRPSERRRVESLSPDWGISIDWG
jgi:lipoate-protein ligase A